MHERNLISGIALFAPINPSLEAMMSNPQSTAKIAGHPIHPMLVPFPIVFFISAFVCDLVFWSASDAAWATAAIWLLGAGLVMAALAAVAGFIEVMGEPRIRALNDVWLHAGGNVVVVLIELYNWSIRYSEGSTVIIPTGIILSLIAVCILIFTGWKGGEMVYRHRVGVSEDIDPRTQNIPRRAA